MWKGKCAGCCEQELFRHSLCMMDWRPSRGLHCNDFGGGVWFGRLAIEISSHHTPKNFLSRRNSFHTDFNDVPTIAASDNTDTLDARMTSPSLTQEREANLLSDSVYRQAAVSGSSNTQQPASSNVTHDGRSCGKQQRCLNVVRICGKLEQSDCSDVEHSLLNGTRDREFGSASSQEQ